MNYTKLAVFIFALIFSFKCISAQESDSIPPELIGSWLITEVYADDTSSTVDSIETQALMDDLVNNNTVIFEFSLNTFQVKINGNLIGSCDYILGNSRRVLFDENCLSLNETVKDIIGESLSGNELRLKSSPPDGDSQLTYHKLLIRQ